MKTVLDLTDRLPFRIDVDRMRAELADVESKPWLDHYDKGVSDGWTALPLVSRDGTMDRADSQRHGKWGEYKRTPLVDDLPYFREILDAFRCPQGRIRLSRMAPGSTIRPHRDVFEEVSNLAFGQVRLHVPILTSDQVEFIVGGERIQMLPGRLYYVNFSKKHEVHNRGRDPRVHLMLDLKVNDWLRDIFPPLSLTDRISNAIVRCALPIAWRTRAATIRLKNKVWKQYDGSRLQAWRRRLRASKPAKSP
jgi:hypothetical protein